jgi:hypothetical protein
VTLSDIDTNSPALLISQFPDVHSKLESPVQFSRALMKVSNYGKRFSIARQLHPNSMSLLRDVNDHEKTWKSEHLPMPGYWSFFSIWPIFRPHSTKANRRGPAQNASKCRTIPGFGAAERVDDVKDGRCLNFYVFT